MLTPLLVHSKIYEYTIIAVERNEGSLKIVEYRDRRIPNSVNLVAKRGQYSGEAFDDTQIRFNECIQLRNAFIYNTCMLERIRNEAGVKQRPSSTIRHPNLIACYSP